MMDQFQTMTTKQFVEADEDLVDLKDLLIDVSTLCDRMISDYKNEDMRRECNMILLANASTFDRVNSVLSMLRKNKP